jgi:hypothetical protein
MRRPSMDARLPQRHAAAPAPSAWATPGAGARLQQLWGSPASTPLLPRRQAPQHLQRPGFTGGRQPAPLPPAGLAQAPAMTARGGRHAWGQPQAPAAPVAAAGHRQQQQQQQQRRWQQDRGQQQPGRGRAALGSAAETGVERGPAGQEGGSFADEIRRAANVARLPLGRPPNSDAVEAHLRKMELGAQAYQQKKAAVEQVGWGRGGGEGGSGVRLGCGCGGLRHACAHAMACSWSGVAGGADRVVSTPANSCLPKRLDCEPQRPPAGLSTSPLLVLLAALLAPGGA